MTTSRSQESDGPLAGVRVLDLTQLLPGPIATLQLADLGAEVIKVESRLGDLTRQVPPRVKHRSAYFLSLNRNKRSLGVDLRRAAGRDIFMALVKRSDVVAESFRPGRVDRMGIGPEACTTANPALVYCSVSGLGQTGPDRDHVGHDITYLARSGILGLWGTSPDAAIPPVQMADMAGGLSASFAIAAALFERERTGKGQVIDVSILDAITSWLGFHLAAHGAGAGNEQRLPLSGRYPFYNVYETADGGWVALGALEPLFWRDFCAAVDRPDLAGKQFVDGDERAGLFDELRAIFGGRDADDWRALISEHDLAAAVVASLDDVAADAHLRSRGTLLSLAHPDEGPVPQTDTPVRSNRRPPNPLRPPPDLGADTRDVLREVLDLDSASVENLIDEGAVFDRSAPGRRIAPDELP